jgi:hypothetical protein
MRLSRNIPGEEFVRALRGLGHEPARPPGSHIRPIARGGKEQQAAIPRHSPSRIDTFAAALADIAPHHGVSREALTERLFRT